MEPEEDQPEDLASLGFTSFGSRNKRPKHHHGTKGSNSNLISLVPPPGAAEVTTSTSTEGAKSLSKKPDFTPYVAPAFTPYVPPRFVGGAGGRGGRTGGGGRDELYSPRFVENPWKALEVKFGIRAEWVDMEKIEGGGGGDEEGGEEIQGEGGEEGEERMTGSAERVEVRMQGKADGFGERGEN
ncbi:hypothetical protein B9Z19DRAFT_1123800 [Tuber borchii]|uniref:Uncharacterized protein n=1 Tax=Tuber borchii TaxID=42251 RepID=A0A2T6ZY06_TUBBO|nr:hypothetical protein B9Z19DRAFT_1123800 [Tuber borchii]